jgi:sugar phosphate isomerase/epimerase
MTPRELAIEVLKELEELLAEHGIKIESSDREGRPEEACIYGAEYYALEDAVEGIIAKGSKREGKLEQAREIAFDILEEFEELLDRYGIRVPSTDPMRPFGRIGLWLPEWLKVRERIVGVVMQDGGA